MFRSAVLASLTAAALAAASQQPAPAPIASFDGAISGFVVDGSTGAPVADAIVAVMQSGATTLPPGYQSRQLTDVKGRFAFLNLPSDGSFLIMTAKFGYLDGGYGRDHAPMDPLRPVAISKGAWVGNLRVPIWRPAVISGTVRDEGGEAQVGVIVRVLGRIRVAGRDELATGPGTITDDLGRYRLSGLAPGRYVIQVPSTQVTVPADTNVGAARGDAAEGAVEIDDSTRLVIGRYPLPPPRANGRAMAYAAAFHPSASRPAEAATVDLQFGDDRQGIDVILTPVPAFRVSGIVLGPPEALVTLTLRLLPAGMENLGFGAEAATALVGPGGAFTFLNVPAGAYVLEAPLTFNGLTMHAGPSSGSGFRRDVEPPTPPPRAGYSVSGRNTMLPDVMLTMYNFRGGAAAKTAPFTARMPVAVNGDMTGVTVKLQPAVTLRGRMTVDADPAKPVPKLPSLTPFMDAASGAPGLGQPSPNGPVGADADFEIPGIIAGEYFLRAPTFSGFQVKSILWRGRDYTHIPFEAAGEDITGVELVVTNATPVLSGTVRTQAGGVPDAGLVVFFPADPDLRVRTGLRSPAFVSAAIQNNGAYQLASLPAGEFFVAAIPAAHGLAWRDQEFLRRLERQATRVALGWGQRMTRDLTLTEIK